MKRLMCLFLAGIFLVGCSGGQTASEAEAFMKEFLQKAYGLKLEAELENPEEFESYWEDFYKDIFDLCTEEGYDRIVSRAYLAKWASKALKDGFEISIENVQLDYDEELKQAKYTVDLTMAYGDGGKETKEIKGTLAIEETEEGKYKVNTMFEEK